MKVSILLTTYNSEKVIKETLYSLINQDYLNTEIIISDDASTDNTLLVIDQILRKTGYKKIIINRNENRLGVVGNFLKAYSLSSGEYICNAGHDDISIKERVSICVDILNKNKNIKLVASDAFDMTKNGDVVGVKEISNLEEWDVNKWFKQRPFFFGASFFLRKELIELNKINNKLLYEDQVLAYRAILQKSAIRYKEPLIFHRRGGFSQKEKIEYIKKTDRKGISAKNEIIEFNQFQKDEKMINLCLNTREKYNYIYQNIYIYKLFKSLKLQHKLKIFFTYNRLDMAKKVKYLKYYLFKNLVNKFDNENTNRGNSLRSRESYTTDSSKNL